MLQTLCDWIATFPGFAGKQFRLDCLEAHADAASVLCKGLKILDARRDVLGRLTRDEQLTLLVQVRGIDAQTMLRFGDWARTGAPVLGLEQRVQVEQGSIYKSSPCGLCTYQCCLTLEYTKEYEEG